MKKLVTNFLILLVLITCVCFLFSCKDSEVEDTRHQHAFVSTTVSATCTQGGYALYVCACGENYKSDFIDAIGHSFTNYVSNNDATLETNGTKTAVCDHENCAVTDTKIDLGSMLGHRHDFKTVVTNPTCTENGYTTYSCLCGNTYKDNYIEATGHNYIQSGINPTCREGGYTTYACVCGDTYTDNKDMLGHTFVNNSCIRCNQPKPTEGLNYYLSDDLTYYSVSSIGAASDKDIVIADMYNGKPVKEIWLAFKENETIKSIRIPDTIVEIMGEAFYRCLGITDIIVDSNSEHFVCENNVLYNKDKTEIIFATASMGSSFTIPASVNSIRSCAFNACSNLQTISVSAENSNYINENGIIFSANKTNLVFANGSVSGSYVIPDTVENIGDYAFKNCTSLVSVTVPESVFHIGFGAFYNCSSLRDIILTEQRASVWIGGVDRMAYQNVNLQNSEYVASLLTGDNCLSDWLKVLSAT